MDVFLFFVLLLTFELSMFISSLESYTSKSGTPFGRLEKLMWKKSKKKSRRGTVTVFFGAQLPGKGV